MEARLVPINAVLDLALADGLNPAPLAAAGWRVACLEVPVLTEFGTVVCDIVLFNAAIGHLLVVEAKSGANIEEAQGRRLAAIDPQALIIAGGITIPQAVQLRSEAVFACMTRHLARITKGIAAAGFALPVLAVDASQAQLLGQEFASADLASALSGATVWTHPIARIIPFDNESPTHLFDAPVRAELELVRKVTEAARRAAREEPERLRFEAATGTTEPRLVILRSPEQFDRRGRTQGYQAVFAGRSRRRPALEVPGQLDLFTELDQAERVTADDPGQNDSDGGDDVQGGERQ